MHHEKGWGVKDLDVHDDRLMTEFLLRRLDPEAAERVADRLVSDPDYFEAMAAFEDDLILRWHHRQLSAEDQAGFAEAYLSSPARRARVDAALALVKEAEAWTDEENPSTWGRMIQWLRAPSAVPRASLAAVGVFVALALSGAVYVANDALRRLRTVGEQQAAARHVIAAFTLTAVGERGSAPGPSLDRVALRPDADEIQLTFDLDDPAEDGTFSAELQALDRGGVTVLDPPRIERTSTVARATITVPAGVLPDGDYVLRIRRGGAGATAVAGTRAFRVTRERAPAR